MFLHLQGRVGDSSEYLINDIVLQPWHKESFGQNPKLCQLSGSLAILMNVILQGYNFPLSHAPVVNPVDKKSKD